MNDCEMQTRAAEQVKKDFPVGTRVIITHINENGYKQDCVGGTGTVDYVDDMGQVDVCMDDGQSVCMCRYYGDQFHKI